MVQLQTIPRILLSGSDDKQPLPGSEQKLRSDPLSGSDQKFGSILSSWTGDMGNLCTIQAGGARVVNPPHSLEELLAVMAVKDEINIGAIDQARVIREGMRCFGIK